MRFTDISILDPVMSIGVALFILFHVCKNIKETLHLFLIKIPNGLSVEELREHVAEIEGVIDVHHIHIWSLDGRNHYASMHIVTDADASVVKKLVREELAEHGISHVTLELERGDEKWIILRYTVCVTNNTL